MKRGSFILSLIASLVFHAALLALPSRTTPKPTEVAKALPVEIVETELARLTPEEQPDEDPEPEAEPVTKQESSPEPHAETEPVHETPPVPEPAPKPKPEPTPSSEPTAPPAPERAEPAPPGPIRPPRPSLVQMLEEARTALPAGGDFGGAPEATSPSRPELRIDWGGSAEAQAVLEAGAMRVVIVRGPAAEVVIDDEMIAMEGRWTRRKYQPPITARYSNRMRIVDDVPAFDAPRGAAGLRGDEHLAVLVPEQIERLLVSAEIRAAYRSGLSLDDVRSLAGRFTLRDGTLAFETSHVQPRAMRGGERSDES